MTRERDRYGRASLGERLADIPEWFRTHRSITLVVAFLVGGMLLVRFLQPDYVAIADVRPGDCLYAREGFSGFVERGRCEVDHSHEVSGVFDLTPDQSTRDRAEVVAEQRAACGRRLRVVRRRAAGRLALRESHGPERSDDLAGRSDPRRLPRRDGRRPTIQRERKGHRLVA